MPKGEPYDFLIVGAGIAGLSSAYHLAKDGYRVLVLERSNSKDNASFNSTAMMCHDPDVDWQDVVARFGESGARDIWDVSELGFRELIRYAHEQKPGFTAKRTPSHIFSNSPERSVELRAQYELYKKIGADATFTENGATISPAFGSAVTVDNDGVTNNQAILRTLTERVRKMGGMVMHEHPVDTLSFESGVAEASVAGKIFRGKEAIIATGDQTLAPDLPKTKTLRTFVVGFEKHGMPALLHNSILWDNDEPYHYIRSFKGSVLWVGGEDVAESEYDAKKDYYAPLEAFAKEKLGVDPSYKRISEWSGTFYPTATGVPCIGKVPDRPLHVAYGFGGTGVVMSFVSGYLLSSWMKGEHVQYQKLFSTEVS